MKVVQAALRDVADTLRLDAQGDLTLPLLELAKAYNSLVSKHEEYFELTEASTGKELKIAVAALKLKEKVSLLHLFRDSVRVITRAKIQPPPEAAKPGQVHQESSMAERLKAMEEEEKIKFRALARKVLLFTLAPLPPLLVGAVVAIAWSKGHMLDSGLVNGFMSTVLEMFKLIFTT